MIMPFVVRPNTALAEVERLYVTHVLTATGWNVSVAARVLRLHRRTLQRKMRAWGM